MNHSKRISALLAVLLLGIVASDARPVFLILDASKGAQAPSKYGYHVVATRNGEETDFVISLSAGASSALRGANVFFPAGRDSEGPPAVRIAEANDRKTIRFSVPTKSLPQALLHVKSGPVPGTDTPDYNFAGYRLVLASISTFRRIDPATDKVALLTEVSVTRGDEAVDLLLRFKAQDPEFVWKATQTVVSLGSATLLIPDGRIPLGLNRSGWVIEISCKLPVNLEPKAEIELVYQESGGFGHQPWDPPRKSAIRVKLADLESFPDQEDAPKR